MARVFTAVDIDEQKLLSELTEIRDRLDLGFKPVKPQKMHITFEFFSDLTPHQINKVRSAIDQVTLEPFKAQIRGIDTFPSNDYIRVVWAGAHSEKFAELYNQVSDHEVKPDNGHDFVPHITLLRAENLDPDRKRKLKKMIDEFEDHYFGSFEVNRLKLFESKLKPNGSQYQELYVKDL